jgi:hypothetical protein
MSTRHLNPADWIETHCPGALHAIISGRHYVVSRSENMLLWPNQPVYACLLGEEAFGQYATYDEAKAACLADAIAATGHATFGALGNEWGRHGTVTR